MAEIPQTALVPSAQPSPFSPTRPPGRRTRRGLEKDVSPADLSTYDLYGVRVTAKDDHVLRLLALSDEREYEKMIRTDTAISGAVEQRIAGVISSGSQVVTGPSRSPLAFRLKNFTVRLLKMIPALGTIRRESLKAIYYGWVPVEKQWRFDASFGPDSGLPGNRGWGISRIVVRKPWHYHIAEGGKYLIRTSTKDGKPVILDSAVDQLRWSVFTAGSTESPYGESWLRRVWLLFYLSKKFERMSGQQMQRALGLIKVNLGSGHSNNRSQADLDADLSRVLNLLNSYNILWEASGATITVETIDNVTRNTRELLDYFNTQKRIAIVGQNLSSEVRAGSFAATQSHVDEVLKSYIEADAREESSWWNDQIIRPAIELNFGADIDEMDMPRWQPNVSRRRVDLEATKTYFDMGGTIDARVFAESADIPAALQDGEGGEGEELRKSEQDQGGARRRGRPPVRRTDESGQDEDGDRGGDDEVEDVARTTVIRATPWDEVAIRS